MKRSERGKNKKLLDFLTLIIVLDYVLERNWFSQGGYRKKSQPPRYSTSISYHYQRTNQGTSKAKTHTFQDQNMKKTRSFPSNLLQNQFRTQAIFVKPKVGEKEK